ncbi:uncharacterized protein [Venturia canescens]|uniref:uncharacterized protein n=1 Tax=Venturia canescens TaxID=32260 RepID=UPI001C9C69F8|nr:uncharacterized protein LOC122406291 [Venturia canescens]
MKRNHYRHYSKPHTEDGGTEGIPRKKNEGLEQSNDDPPKKYKEAKQELEEISERIDIYYFDHGNSAYYRTTDSPPVLATEKCAEKTDSAATRFWAEIFGTIHIGIAFLTAFVLQLLRFVLYSIVRPLTVGTLQLLADYFVKPLLSIFFNAIIQPVLILLYNVATSIRDLCEPIAEALGFFLREVAAVVRAFRIVEVNRTSNPITGGCT